MTSEDSSGFSEWPLGQVVTAIGQDSPRDVAELDGRGGHRGEVVDAFTAFAQPVVMQVALLLQKTLKIKILPENLDATDGLAAAMCHYYQRTAGTALSKAKNWKTFIRENPGRVK